MSKTNVTKLGPTANFSAKQALQYALDRCEEAGMKDVLLCGYYEDGEFFTFSSKMTRQDGLWLAECLRDWALHGSND